MQIRFREADDSSASATGWWVDDISVASGVAWTLIGTSSAGATSYSWTTPAVAGDDYCVRIHGSDSNFGDSDFDTAGPFSLSDLIPCTQRPFTDVPVSHPFCAEIDWMKRKSISNGYSDGTFRPGASTTRQAVAPFLARVAGASLTPCTDAPFSDVPVSHPFCAEIAWMKADGISNGYSDGTYRPNAAVTRQAMASFMARVAGASLSPCATAPFSDVPVSHRFCPEIQWLKVSGLTSGYSDGTYRPDAAVTRQAAAAFMYRLATLIN